MEHDFDHGGADGGGAVDETERGGAGDGGREPSWVGTTGRQKKDGTRRGGEEVRRLAPLGVDAPSQRDGDDRRLPGN